MILMNKKAIAVYLVLLAVIAIVCGLIYLSATSGHPYLSAPSTIPVS